MFCKIFQRASIPGSQERGWSQVGSHASIEMDDDYCYQDLYDVFSAWNSGEWNDLIRRARNLRHLPQIVTHKF